MFVSFGLIISISLPDYLQSDHCIIRCYLSYFCSCVCNSHFPYRLSSPSLSLLIFSLLFLLFSFFSHLFSFSSFSPPLTLFLSQCFRFIKYAFNSSNYDSYLLLPFIVYVTMIYLHLLNFSLNNFLGRNLSSCPFFQVSSRFSLFYFLLSYFFFYIYNPRKVFTEVSDPRSRNNLAWGYERDDSVYRLTNDASSV